MEVSGSDFDIDFDFLTGFGVEKAEPPPLLEELDEPYRSRCNTWPRLQQQPHEPVQQRYSPSAALGAVGGPTLPLVSEEEFGSGAEKATTTNAVMLKKSSGPTTTTTTTIGTRRNPWGNMSYADLIGQAITSSPEQRLTLAQIYDWLIKNFAYFAERSDSSSSIGWKNSIRHNLSLHSKFVRVQNEGAGKSSWWTLDAEGGGGGGGASSPSSSTSSGHGTKKAGNSTADQAASGNAATSKSFRRRANTLDSTSRIFDRRKCLKSRPSRRVESRLTERATSNGSLLAAAQFAAAQNELLIPAQDIRQRSPSTGCPSPQPTTRGRARASSGGSFLPSQRRQQQQQQQQQPVWSFVAGQPSPMFPNFTERLTLSGVDTSKDVIGNEYTEGVESCCGGGGGGSSSNGVLEDFDFDASQLLVSYIPPPPELLEDHRRFDEAKNHKIKILEPRRELHANDGYLMVPEGPKSFNYDQNFFCKSEDGGGSSSFVGALLAGGSQGLQEQLNGDNLSFGAAAPALAAFQQQQLQVSKPGPFPDHNLNSAVMGSFDPAAASSAVLSLGSV